MNGINQTVLQAVLHADQCKTYNIAYLLEKLENKYVYRLLVAYEKRFYIVEVFVLQDAVVYDHYEIWEFIRTHSPTEQPVEVSIIDIDSQAYYYTLIKHASFQAEFCTVNIFDVDTAL